MTVTALNARDLRRLDAASGLQEVLPELVALALDARQAAWNVSGPGASTLRALAEELAAESHRWAQRVAERAGALGFFVDARPATVAAAAGVFPIGRIADDAAATCLTELVDDVAATARRVHAQVAEADPVADHVLVEVIEGLERFRWLLRTNES